MKSLLGVFTSCVMAVFIFTSTSQAQLSQQGSKLVGTGAVGSAQQGRSVAVSGDGNTAIVGGDYDSSQVGAAWVYTRSGGVWTQQGSKLVGTGAVGASHQGWSVALSADGNTAIVGGYGDDSNAGAVWVYTRSGGVWSQQGSKLVGTGVVGVSRQGYSVALSADGNTALVGGYNDDSEAGAAWVFTRSGGVWTQEGSKLVGTGAVGAANQGISVALSADGNTAIVGGEIDDSEVGAAWVYTRTGGVWTQQGGKLVGTGAVGTPFQGHSVSLSGDGNTALVGGNYDDSQTGAAWVFTRSGGVWTQEGSKLIGTGAIGTARQGSSVSLSDDGNTALVGGETDDSGMGAVWVYQRSGGVWTQQGEKLVGLDVSGNSYQGTSVSLSDDGNTALAGGYLDNSSAGAAWVYFGPDTTWPVGTIGAYNFNGDLTDGVGSNDGTDFGTVGYGTGGGRTWVSLGSDGGVTFPPAMNDSLFSQGSMSIGFDFRLGGSDQTILLGTGLFGINAFWQDAGIILLFQGGELVLTYTDGIDLDGYVWQPIQTGLTPGPWHTLNVAFNLENRTWKVELDGEATTGMIPMAMDADSLGRAVEMHTVTLGGIDGNNYYAGTVDIAAMRVVTGSSAEGAAVRSAFQDLVDHINAITPLTSPELEDRFDVIYADLPLAEYDSIAADLFAFTDAYEAAYPPIYQDGIKHTFEELPPLDRTLQTAQEYVLQTRFTPTHVASMGGVKFEHAAVIPGTVDSSTARIPSAVVEVNGSYAVDIAAELTDQSRVVRPTGTYLAPGDLVTIHAPGGVLGQGLSIVVGVHFRDMDYEYIGPINRFPDISTEFPLDSTTITVGNPMGGGIYLKVPDGASAGWFNLTIENAVMSPYFSWRAGRETDVNDWLLQVAGTGAPWADFESDKAMFTLPVAKLAGVDHPDSIMMRWDAIMDAISDVGGRPHTRPRAEFFTFDTRLVTPVYGAGYPMVGELSALDSPSWNPLEVLTTPPNVVMLHEMGHNHLHPTLSYGPTFDECHEIEAETIVHTLIFSVFHNVYGYTTEEAFLNSAPWPGTGFTLEEAAFDWIITTNFRTGMPMDYDSTAPMPDKDMLKYQSRGLAKYGDIARWFGWDVLYATNAAFYDSGVPQSGTACPSKPFIVTRDEYIQAASEVAGVNMAPLFHFWGVPPSPVLAETLAANYPPSQKVLEMILHYRSVVAPKTSADYNAYHTAMYSRLGYQQPRYDEYIVQFDSTFANAILAEFDWIIAHYGLSDLIVARQFDVGEKWNIVSVPLRMEDYGSPELFPTATTSAYAFEGGYVIRDTLSNGVGYWMKFPSGQTVEHIGLERLEDTIDVQEGWNMVGSLSVPVAVSGIGSVPGGIVTSAFYRYDNGYAASDTLEPGSGYWVKASQAGQLVISVTVSATPANRIRIETTDELPPPPPEDDIAETEVLLPARYALGQNYPNPFNPVTSIRYALPEAAKVRLSIYNVLGQEVAVLVDGTQDAGYKAVSFDASAMPSGMYVYRITAGTFTDVKKMLLLK